jgi:hypothetical protein
LEFAFSISGFVPSALTLKTNEEVVELNITSSTSLSVNPFCCLTAPLLTQ